jgi:hypothetical protein
VTAETAFSRSACASTAWRPKPYALWADR